MSIKPDNSGEPATWRNGARSGIAADLSRFFASSPADSRRTFALERITAGVPLRSDLFYIVQGLELHMDPERVKSASTRKTAARLLGRLHWANGCDAEAAATDDSDDAARTLAQPAARGADAGPGASAQAQAILDADVRDGRRDPTALTLAQLRDGTGFERGARFVPESVALELRRDLAGAVGTVASLRDELHQCRALLGAAERDRDSFRASLYPREA